MISIVQLELMGAGRGRLPEGILEAILAALEVILVEEGLGVVVASFEHGTSAVHSTQLSQSQGSVVVAAEASDVGLAGISA